MSGKKTKDKDVKSKTLLKVVGTPTMMLLPARNYKFKVYSEDHVITIPRRGVYKDFDKELYSDEDGEFNILEENILYIPSLSKVLFATSQYPKLKSNQAFTPIALVIEEDKVQIIGNIIEMLKESV